MNQAFIQLTDKVALVTGASRGIGSATAKLLAAAGAQVVGLARNQQDLQDLQGSIIKSGGNCQVFTCDVSQSESLELCLRQIVEQFGKIDILINNAGIYQSDAVQDITKDAWDKVMETNASSAFVATKSVLKDMIKAKWGRIIFVSSISGKDGEPYGASYSASKFALIGLMQSLSLEVARHGITSNAVCPGWVDTKMAHEQLNNEKWCNLNLIEPSQSEEIARLSIPQERLIEPQEVANLILYLCSDLARGITGQAINICGGLSVT